MILLSTETTLITVAASDWVKLGAMGLGFITTILTLIFGFWKLTKEQRLTLRKVQKEHSLAIERLLEDKKLQFRYEMDKMQAKSLAESYRVLKFIYPKPTPNSMFRKEKSDKGKNTFLKKKNAEDFMNEMADYFYGKYGQLFLPKKVRISLYTLHGIVGDILRLEKDNANEDILLYDKDAVKKIDQIISGGDNIFKQVRAEIGLENRCISLKEEAIN